MPVTEESLTNEMECIESMKNIYKRDIKYYKDKLNSYFDPMEIIKLEKMLDE